jgi:hypothetical protein
MNNEQQHHHPLVTLSNGQPFTDTLIIAEGVDRPHHGVIQLVRQNKADFEQFGLVTFEMRPRLEGQHGGGDIEYAVLNERQATLLLTYMRNTDVVKQFKIALIKAFFSMAEALLRPAPETIGLTMAIGDFPEGDRPVVVSTTFGHAYVNTATYLLFNLARVRPGGEEGRQLAAAMSARVAFNQALPAAFKIKDKMTRALLKANPLWSDILHCQRMGLTKATVARICGCHGSTIKRHLKKMEEAGLFDDPLASIKGTVLELPAKEERPWI